MAPAEVIDAYVGRSSGGRRLSGSEWGLTVPAEEAAGEPLEVGVSIADDLVRASAAALPQGSELDPWMLLWWNRQARLVRYGSTRTREIWVHGDLPLVGLGEPALERMVRLVTEAAVAIREYARAARRSAEPPSPPGVGPPRRRNGSR